MKVLHLIPSLGLGGAERQLVNVVTHSGALGIGHTICHLGEPSDVGDELRAAGYDVVTLGLPRARAWQQAVPRFRAIVATRQPDIVHSWLFDANMVARMACLSLRHSPPLVTSLQSPDYDPETVRRSGWNPWRVRALQTIDIITAAVARPTYVPCSDYVAHSAHKELFIPMKRMETIHNSVNMARMQVDKFAGFAVRDALGIPRDAMVIINVGRLDPPKAQGDLIEAFASLAPGRPKLHLVIVGRGPLEQELRVLAKTRGVEARVHLLGHRRDIGACLAMSDIFAFPSVSEGFSLALLEGMAAGLACIASNIGPMPEVIETGVSGLLIEPGSVDGLTKALRSVVDDAAVRERFASAAIKIAPRFSSEALAQRWVDLYKAVSSRQPLRSVA